MKFFRETQMSAFDRVGGSETGNAPHDQGGQEASSPELNSENGFEIPSINLPKGGGAIRGIGEKFAANPVNGTGSISVPLATSPGPLDLVRSFPSPTTLAQAMA